MRNAWKSGEEWYAKAEAMITAAKSQTEEGEPKVILGVTTYYSALEGLEKVKSEGEVLTVEEKIF